MAFRPCRSSISLLEDASFPLESPVLADISTRPQSLDFRFIPNQTTLKELVEWARDNFHAKNLSLLNMPNTLATLHPLHGGLKTIAGDDANEVIIGDILKDGDTILVTKENNASHENICVDHQVLHLVEFSQAKHVSDMTSSGIYEIQSFRLNDYHVHIGVSLIRKMEILFVDIEVEQRTYTRFSLPSRYHSTTAVRGANQAVIPLFSSRIHDLLVAIQQKYGFDKHEMQQRRLALFSRTDHKWWYEDLHLRHKDEQLLLDDLGLSGPILKGSFDTQRLVRIQTSIVGKALVLRTRLSESIARTKHRIEQVIGLPPTQQRLVLEKVVMDDEHQSLAQYGVQHRDTMKLELLLPPLDEEDERSRDCSRDKENDDSTSTIFLQVMLPNCAQTTIRIKSHCTLAYLQAKLSTSERLGATSK